MSRAPATPAVVRASRAARVPALLCALLAGCSGSAEQPVVGEFFRASRLLDGTALAAVSTVIFDPRTHGTVASFTITAMSEEERSPLPSPAAAADRALTLAIEASLRGGGLEAGEPAYDGEIVTRTVTVSAPVRMPEGGEARKTIVLRLQRAILRGDRKLIGRWIVTGFREPAESVFTTAPPA